MKMMSKVCTLLLSAVLCVGMAAPAFAYGGDTEEVELPILTASSDEEDLAVFNNDRAHHRYDVEIPTANDSENQSDYVEYERATTVTDTYHETKTRFAWVGEIKNEKLHAGLEHLSDDDLSLVTLFVHDGLTITEISKVYGVSQPTISIKMKRITKFLKNFDFDAIK